MTQRGQGEIDYLAEAWEDIRIIPGAFQFPGSADPAFADWQPGGSGATFKVYEFNNADEAFFALQLPHAYKGESDLLAHVHWTPGDRGVAEDTKTVAWKLDYSIISVNGVFLASATADMTDTCDGVDHKHLMTPEVTISGTGLGVSAMMIGRIYRDAGDTWVTNTAGNCPILLELDLHYQATTIGSETTTAKDN